MAIHHLANEFLTHSGNTLRGGGVETFIDLFVENFTWKTRLRHFQNRLHGLLSFINFYCFNTKIIKNDSIYRYQHIEIILDGVITIVSINLTYSLHFISVVYRNISYPNTVLLIHLHVSCLHNSIISDYFQNGDDILSGFLMSRRISLIPIEFRIDMILTKFSTSVIINFNFTYLLGWR